MNKLITTNTGGFPFQLDDLRFIDESVREVLKANLERYIDKTDPNDKGFLIENSLLQRNDILNPKVGGNNGQAMPEMFVYISGEIYYLPAGNLPAGLSNSVGLYVEPDISFTNTTPGQKVFESGTTYQTYQIRRAKYTLTPTQPNYIRINASTSMNSNNIIAGYDFEFATRCSLIQREFQALKIDSLEQTDDSIFQLIQFLNSKITNVENRLNPILDDDWISVPRSVLTRTTNPVVFISSTADPNASTFKSLNSVGGSIQTSNYIFKLKRIGKMVICSFSLDILFPNWPEVTQGFFIDLNNLGVSGFTGGTVQSFFDSVNCYGQMLSPASDKLEVIQGNNIANVTGRNGLFFRMRTGTGRNYAYLNANYLHTPEVYPWVGFIRTKTFINDDSYPINDVYYDINGQIIFEMY